MGITARVRELERKQAPREMPRLNLGCECDNLQWLREMVARFERENDPTGAGIHHYAIWTGEPNAEAEALAGEGYQPNKYTTRTT